MTPSPARDPVSQVLSSFIGGYPAALITAPVVIAVTGSNLLAGLLALLFGATAAVWLGPWVELAFAGKAG
ncbi:MAG: hypothetical protein K0S42_128 [Microvirga sp.]|jgi:hypothetical protein|nr:hypothetical protein [Microvirga sp.]